MNRLRQGRYHNHGAPATGQKLRRTALRLAGPGGAVTATGFTEYHGPAVYQWAGTLEQAPALPASVATDEGRLVNLPGLPLGHPDTYEYHYKDHLGNLRLAYRPRTPQGRQLRLTNEPTNQADEQDNQGFANFVPHRSAVRAHAGAHSLRATAATGRTGRVALRVRLLAGQALAAGAMALYEGNAGAARQGAALPAGRTAPAGAAPAAGEAVRPGTTAAPALAMQQPATLAARVPDPGVPRARLVLKLYATEAGPELLHQQESYMDNSASWAWQQLTVGKKADQDCWAEVYVENLSSQAVWFDDLEIATGALPTALVVQETHYDPWGLELAGIGYVADPAKESKFTYNGKEKQDQFGLGWLDYGARGYDPATSRWWQIDPSVQKYEGISPYAYAFNNPIRFVDIKGKDPGDVVVVFAGGNLFATIGPGYKYEGTMGEVVSSIRHQFTQPRGGEIGIFQSPVFGNEWVECPNCGTAGGSGALVSHTYPLEGDAPLDKLTQEAYDFVLANYNKDGGKDVKGGQLIIAGYSYGGVLAMHLARRLKDHKINLLVTLDPAAGTSSDKVDRSIPDNVDENTNVYQTKEDNGRGWPWGIHPGNPVGSYGAPNTRQKGSSKQGINNIRVTVDHNEVDDAYKQQVIDWVLSKLRN